MPVAYFLVPYEWHPIGRRTVRRLEMATVNHLDWQEAEIDGNEAIVRVRASEAEIRNLTRNWQLVDPEDYWTPTRREPAGDRLFPCKTLGQLRRDVCTDQKHGRLERIAEHFMRRADREGYVRLWGLDWPTAAKVLGLCSREGYGLNRVSTGTFPTTGVLDDFNRADSNDLGANWTPINSGLVGGTMRIVSEKAAPEATAERGGEWWNPTTFGPDSESYATITMTGNDQWWDVYVRLLDPADTGVDGYGFEAEHTAGTDQAYLYRIDNHVTTLLGAAIQAGDWSDQDKIGFEVIGTTFQGYRFTGGVWAAYGTTRSDATYGAAGNIAMYCDESVTLGARMDDFGGGTVTAVGAFKPVAAFVAGGMIGGGVLA